MSRKLACILVLVLSWLSCANVEAQTLPDWFGVKMMDNKGAYVRGFHCQTTQGKAVCKETELSVSYYDWENAAGVKEPQRCSIVAGRLEDQEYRFVYPNRWQHIETGGLCGATIAITLIANGKKVAMEQVTIDNPGMSVGDGQICKDTWGPSGTKKTAQPVESLGLGDDFSMKCSSLNISTP